MCVASVVPEGGGGQDPVALGLSSEEAERRFDGGLGNEAPDNLTRSIWAILGANVFTLFNGIVFTAFVILLVMGRWQDAIFGLPGLANTLIGVWQETSAKRTLDQLAVLNAPTARVLRDGVPVELPPARVVVGDVLVLRVGDQVAADAVLVTAPSGEDSSIDADESLLTGESDSVRKEPGDEVHSGSSVSRGKAYAEVIRAGADSYASRVTADAKRFQLVRSELRESIDRLLKWISIALAPMVVIIITGQVRAFGGWDVALESSAWEGAVVGAVAAVIAMVPLGLVLLTSIAFAAGGLALARNQVLIQELPAVEGLARVNALCLDKTGTITTGELEFDALHEFNSVLGAVVVLAHIGSAPDANLTASALGDAFSGEPITVTMDIPFDSERKWSGLVVTDRAGVVEAGTWIFGAPDCVLAPCIAASAVFVLGRAGELAASGLRTLVLAHSADVTRQDPDEPRLPGGMVPVALITFREQVRADAAETVAYFAEQGVDVYVISGDNPRTVAAVARQVGIATEGGVDARGLPAGIDELAEVMVRERVFGRVTPAQKVSMVQALHRNDRVVAMIGDGVNDVLAVKEADMGIAMGSAAQSTRAVARLILLDGKFSRLAGVVAEGRRVIANIERVSKLFLTKTTYAFGIGVVFGLTAWGFPFLPRQLSILDGLGIGIPAFFIALMPNTTRYSEGFMIRAVQFSVPAGSTITAAMVVLYLMAAQLGGFSTVAMQSASTLVVAGIALWVLSVLARPFHWARLLIVVAMYAGLWLVWAIPFTREFWNLTFLPEQLAGVVLVIVLLGMLLVELLRAWHAHVTRERPRPRPE